MSKLHFRTLLAGLAFAFLGQCSTAPKLVTQFSQELKNPFPILQGPTSENVTQISVLLPKKTAFTVFLREKKTQKTFPHHLLVRNTAEPLDVEIHTYTFQGLQPHTAYELVVQDSTRNAVDVRNLKTLDVSKKNLRFAVASCMDDHYIKEQKPMWTELLAQKPDLIFFIGDNVYADEEINFYKGPAPEQTLWQRHIETRIRLEVFRSKDLVPIFATWDDHDYGQNDGDKTNPYKEVSTRIFQAFFPRDPISGVYEKGPGMASYLHTPTLNFFLMDDRSFRSSNKPDNTPQTHWGFEQENWLLEHLVQLQMPAWIINGDQFFGGYHTYESYQGNHPQSFEAFIQSLIEIPVPLVFLSGDRHFTELLKIPPSFLGYETYEVTSSPIHAKLFPDLKDRFQSPYRVHATSDRFNYAVIGSGPNTRNKLSFDLNFYGPNQQVLYHEKLSVQKGAPQRAPAAQKSQ